MFDNSNEKMKFNVDMNTPKKSIINSESKDGTSASSIPKPDLSPIVENNKVFSLKTFGSYKKPKTIVPESPMKSPIHKFFTPNKVQGKNLFGAFSNMKSDGLKPKKLFDNSDEGNNNQITQNTKYKTKFLDLLAGVEEKDEDDTISPKHKFLGEKKQNQDNFSLGPVTFKLFNNSNSPLRDKENDENEEPNKFKLFNSRFGINLHYAYHKMDNEYNILKSLSSSKFVQVFKCENKFTKQIQVVKKINKISMKNDIKTLDMIYNDLNANAPNNPNSKFAILIKDYWIEEETEEVMPFDSKMSRFKDKNYYFLYDYCSNGDVLDYLSKLELQLFNFTPDFYWDLLFEMLIGVLFIHQNGFLHLDIKPENFLVDSKGFIKLTDYGLSKKLSEITNIEDVFDGDSTYISQEFFKRKSVKDLSTKCDVYSLGLSFLEILAKVELPKNGPLWIEMREYKMKSFPKEFLINWNINDIQPFLLLIQKMIAPPEERYEIIQILNDQVNFPDIFKRYQAHIQGAYKKSTNIINLSDVNENKVQEEMVIDSPKKNVNKCFKFS